MITSAGIGPIVRFHDNINAIVYKEFLCLHALPHLCRGTVETPIFMQNNASCQKGKKNCIKFSWRWRNIRYEVATTKPRSESSRECMENQRRERPEQKSPKYWWFMCFLKEEWGSTTTNFCKNLDGSCGRRCNEVIQYKGKFTKYWILL